jgi:hypothetical protein
MMSRDFLALFGLSVSAWAGTITVVNVQFAASGYTGAAVVGSAGDYWNSEGAAGTSVALLDTLGQSTSMTLTWSTPRAFAGTTGFASTPYADLMEGYLFNGNAEPVTITLDGLTPDTGFDLYVYSQGDVASGGRAMQVDANGIAADTTTTDAAASTFILCQNYLELPVSANASGQLEISFAPISIANFEAGLNGFQLVSAPEPSTPLGSSAWLTPGATH